MHPAEIKAALAVAGFKQVDLAREFELEPGSISSVINGRSRSRQVEERIAEVTRQPLEVLWPQWYAEGGELILSAAERQLVQLFRKLSPAGQDKLVAQAEAGERAMSSTHTVHASRGSYAAGRDVTIGSKPKRK